MGSLGGVVVGGGGLRGEVGVVILSECRGKGE